MGLANRWEPWTVKDPLLHSFFSDAGAWEFIADCLEAGEIMRDLPRSEKFPDFAVFMVHLPVNGHRRIYMKLAAREDIDFVIGISFHYSTEEYRS